MLISRLNRFALSLLIVFFVASCSKYADIEGLLEKHYRAAARGDSESMASWLDTRMFTLTTLSHRGTLRSKLQQLIAGMNALSNANGELKKIEITKVEEIKDKNETFQKVTFNLIFKNDRTITEQEIISRIDGKAKIYIVNEWAGL